MVFIVLRVGVVWHFTTRVLEHAHYVTFQCHLVDFYAVLVGYSVDLFFHFLVVSLGSITQPKFAYRIVDNRFFFEKVYRLVI